MNQRFDGLTIALSKGRILEETLPLFAKADICPLEDIHHSRKLIFQTTNPDVNFLILRASDVPTYVEHGAADIGVAGKDVLMEYNASVYELLDLKILQQNTPMLPVNTLPTRACRWISSNCMVLWNLRHLWDWVI